MVMVLVHDIYSVFDESKVSLGFNEELDLCLSVFGYIDIRV
jgi:hypothetical protein